MKTIYKPAEDSYLLQETLLAYLKDKPENIKILDMGSGSGIQALTCKKLKFKNVLAADINPESIKHLKKQNLKARKTNLFSNIKTKFDIIIFNPPYLPDDKREPKDSQLQTTAGKQGNELIIKFLNQAKKHLTSDGAILLLFSSLSKPKAIKQKANQLKYKLKLLNKANLQFFEKLFVYELTL